VSRGPAVRQGRRPRHHADLKARGLLLGAEPYTTATRSAGAATRRCSTTPSRPGTSAPPHQGAALAANEAVVWHPEHIKQGASASGSPTTSTGRCRATATGARRCRSGAASTGTRTASARSPSCEMAAGPVPDDLELHRPYVDDVVLAAPSAAATCAASRGHRRLVRLGLDAVRAVALPVRERGDVSPSASPPTSSPRPSTRRAAGSTACSRSRPSLEGQSSYKRVLCLGTSSTPRARR
jgi:hypothetical protein